MPPESFVHSPKLLAAFASHFYPSTILRSVFCFDMVLLLLVELYLDKRLKYFVDE